MEVIEPHLRYCPDSVYAGLRFHVDLLRNMCQTKNAKCKESYKTLEGLGKWFSLRSINHKSTAC